MPKYFLIRQSHMRPLRSVTGAVFQTSLTPSTKQFSRVLLLEEKHNLVYRRPVNLLDFFCINRKFLLYNLVMRNLKIRYRKSFFGMLWTVLVPAGSALIYFAVFHFVLRVKMENYLLHIITGLVPWAFFATTLSVGLEVIVSNYGLLNKVPLPAHALVLAECSTNVLNFFLSIPVIFVVMILSGVLPSWPLLQLFPLTGLLFIITYSFALIFGVLFVFLRDLRYLTGLILQFWFYLTPIMYSPDMIPENFRQFVVLNPIFHIFYGFHLAVVNDQWIPADVWLWILFWVLALLTLSFYTANRLRNSLVEIL